MTIDNKPIPESGIITLTELLSMSGATHLASDLQEAQAAGQAASEGSAADADSAQPEAEKKEEGPIIDAEVVEEKKD